MRDLQRFYDDESNGAVRTRESLSGFIEHLWNTHSREVHGLAAKLIGDHEAAADVCCDTFVSAAVWLRDHADHKPKKVNYRAWLFRIARNHVYQRARRNSPVTLATGDTDDEGTQLEWMAIAAPEAGPDAEAIAAERRGFLHACLEELPDRRRSMVREAYFDGFLHADLAREYGLEVNHVRQELFRARQALRECLERRYRVLSMEGILHG